MALFFFIGIDTSHMLFCGFALVEIKRRSPDQEVIFKDEVSCSSNSERPWVLIPGRENKENFSKLMQLLDSEIQEITTTSIQVSGIDCQILFDLSQLDGKAIVSASGLGGSYCTACKVSEAEGKKPRKNSTRLYHGPKH